METLTVTTYLVTPASDKPLTPAMLRALWVIADAVDKSNIKKSSLSGAWVEIESAKLRTGRDDNVWLRICLTRLMGVKMEGTNEQDEWGAVIVAQWEITDGGSKTRILLPPAAIEVMKAPATFAKIETHAALSLEGHARRLYALLADKKRLKQTYWEFEVNELRRLLSVDEKKAYERWGNLRQWVLLPALQQINDFGTVKVKMTPQRMGRCVNKVRFEWAWKTPSEATETAEENERHSLARGVPVDGERPAPPLIKETAEERAAFVKNLKEKGLLLKR